MELRALGRTGIEVSAVGLGVMTFGAQTDQEEAFAELDRAVDAGINLFDTAENYPAPVLAETQGRSEELLGAWIASRGVRDCVVIATKVTGPRGMEHIRGAERRLDRANITAAVEGSLRRLGTDHIDLYQLHWPDRPVATRSRFVRFADDPAVVPIEVTLEVLGQLAAAGKVRHVGVANETPWGVMRYLAAAEATGLPHVVSIQNGYSLLDRAFELGLAEVALREQVGLLAYSPLAGGLLTGKHLEGVGPGATRATLFPGFDRRLENEKLNAAVTAYVDLARRHDVDPAAMALAFVRQQPFVTSVLMAASTTSQLERNLAAVDVTLPPELLKEINAVHDAAPNPVW